MSAADLMNLVRGLAAPFGLERSVKIVPGALLEDRFLVSLHRSAFGAAPADRLAQMCGALGVPPDFAGAIAAAQADADIIHFGYEDGPGPAIFKVYLEYASAARQARAQNAPDPVLVHLAYKWMPEVPGPGTVTRYSWMPCDSEAAITERIERLAPAGEAPRARRCGLDVVSRACRRTPAGNLFLMAVEEPGNPRQSYDINVYQADLHVRDIADLVGSLARDFAVRQPQIDALLARSGALALGHLAGGRGRDGAEFVTVYYGVEAH
jgi:tryptophan 7-halogenase